MVTRGAAAVDPGVERGGGLDAGMTEQLANASKISGRMIERHLRAHMPKLMRRQQNAFPLLDAYAKFLKFVSVRYPDRLGCDPAARVSADMIEEFVKFQPATCGE